MSVTWPSRLLTVWSISKHCSGSKCKQSISKCCIIMLSSLFSGFLWPFLWWWYWSKWEPIDSNWSSLRQVQPTGTNDTKWKPSLYESWHSKLWKRYATWHLKQREENKQTVIVVLKSPECIQSHNLSSFYTANNSLKYGLYSPQFCWNNLRSWVILNR